MKTIQFENTGGEPVTVFIRALGGGVSKNWQPSQKILPNESAKIQLRGFEPFDILIQEADGSPTLLQKIYLCSIMRECAATGRSKWAIPAVRGKWENGLFSEDKRTTTTLQAGADQSNVAIVFSPIAKPDPIQLPEDPIPKPKPKVPPPNPKPNNPNER